jgi:hypothetical protein
MIMTSPVQRQVLINNLNGPLNGSCLSQKKFAIVVVGGLNGVPGKSLY